MFDWNVNVPSTVTDPDTTKFLLLLLPKVRVPPDSIFSARADPLASSVTVKPEGMMTLSVAAGTLAPEEPPLVVDQVLVELQFPDATAKRSAATVVAPTKS